MKIPGLVLAEGNVQEHECDVYMLYMYDCKHVLRTYNYY